MPGQRRTHRRPPPAAPGTGARGGGAAGAAATPSGATGRTLEEIIDEHFGDVPRAVWDDVPDDFIENMDHYVHGAEKR